MRCLILCLVALFMGFDGRGVAQEDLDQKILKMAERFVDGHEQLAIPVFHYSHENNFANIQDLRGIKRQQLWFRRLQRRLDTTIGRQLANFAVCITER